MALRRRQGGRMRRQANGRFAPIAVVLIDATTLIVMCGLTIGGHPHHLTLPGELVETRHETDTPHQRINAFAKPNCAGAGPRSLCASVDPLNVAIWIEHECGIVVRCVLLAQSRPSVVGLAESQPTFRLTPTAPSTLQCPTLLNCCHAGATVWPGPCPVKPERAR